MPNHTPGEVRLKIATEVCQPTETITNKSTRKLVLSKEKRFPFCNRP
ncbi:MAG: hypothetical protein L6Q53_06005 [Candidatus Brocadia sinica]|nr:hypothetical protein [Candidatus Brocadia sinica]MCK6467730.1 hypothetical protein [Candidatus Brocadia sinica]NOG41922.1 hypothetical protein [Planctomycetota bacterium]NUO04149.1 hypothetical protein [Candidatus Brocadia sinica]